MKTTKKLRVLTWHVHGNYLYYLSQTDCLFYLPVKAGFRGKTAQFPWKDNVIEVSPAEMKYLEIDCILFQSNGNSSQPPYVFFDEQLSMLSLRQIREVPKLFLEHEPPRQHPTDTKHMLYNATIPLIHVTTFNRLMWDSGNTPTVVIEHGVPIPEHSKSVGALKKGVVVINNLPSRGRRLGLDIFEKVRQEIPLDLIGIGSEVLGGIGEISPRDLQEMLSRYRFFFSPARYTSLGLSVIEAMTVGLPIVGLATTALPTVIHNGREGYVDTDMSNLIHHMQALIDNKFLAQQLGKQARKMALQRFHVNRFTAQWKSLFEQTVYQHKRSIFPQQQIPMSKLYQ